jgi:hypothetical protein
MRKIIRFVKLDFLTVKPFFKYKSSWVFILFGFALAIPLRSMSMAVFMLLFMARNWLNYPFSAAENHNLNALYVTLGINRKTVVLGRYVTALAMLGITIFITLAVVTLALLAERVFGMHVHASMGYVYIFMLSIMLIFTQCYEIPAFFASGYGKANIPVMFVSIIIKIGTLILTNHLVVHESFMDNVNEFLHKPVNAVLVLCAIPLTLMVLMYISYRVSYYFYRKREF